MAVLFLFALQLDLCSFMYTIRWCYFGVLWNRIHANNTSPLKFGTLGLGPPRVELWNCLGNFFQSYLDVGELL